MKKSILFLLLTGCLLFQTSTAMADYIYEIKAGDKIKFTNYNSVSGAGEFTWKADIKDGNGNFDDNFDDYVWQSFCVEKNEYVTKNTVYTVQGISGYAKAGGVDKLKYDSNGDPLSDETAWLYWNFSKKKLHGYDSSSTTHQASLQYLIWLLEGEIDSLPNNNFIDDNLITDWRLDYSNSGWKNQGQVQVVNLGYFDTNNKWVGIQDQLIVGHMPEPGTMVLLGFGLIGMAGIGRKKLTK
nr:PEP-CTERM sorting domain-containing protein [Desulfobacula sp.]